MQERPSHPGMVSGIFVLPCHGVTGLEIRPLLKNRGSETGIDQFGDPCYDSRDNRGASGLI